MFRKAIITTAIFLLISLPCAHSGNDVVFACKNLEKAMQDITGRQSVTIADMQMVTGAVDLSGLDITGVAGLEYLTNAESLDLSSNKIKDITPLMELKALHSLYISDNQLKTLPVDIDLMDSLEILDISRNPLAEVPRQIADIPQLKKLVMEDCGLRDIPELCPLADTLKWLSLSGNNLLDYSTVLNLENLEMLQLERCSLSVMPDISLLGNLHYLYIGGNDLKKLPAYLSNLPLARLDAGNNQLSTLPDSFAGLLELKQLVLSGNAFIEVPGVVLAMQGLEVLMLDSNMISSLPPEISMVTSLKRVSFTANDIDSLDSLTNFKPAAPGQISFALNRLDYSGMSPASVFVLASLGTGTQVQKNGGIRLAILKADTASIDFRIEFSTQPESEMKAGELVPWQIRLYDISSGYPVFLQSYDALDDLKCSYSKDLEENGSYKLRVVLAMKYENDAARSIYYYDDIVIYELAPAPTGFIYSGVTFG